VCVRANDVVARVSTHKVSGSQGKNLPVILSFVVVRNAAAAVFLAVSASRMTKRWIVRIVVRSTPERRVRQADTMRRNERLG
jgi:hypothetical protein